MKTFFSISQAWNGGFKPPISYKVREYFVAFIVSNILEKEKLIIGGKWHFNLTVYFVAEGRLGLPTNVVFAKTPKTISAESIKLYEALIPVKPIQQSDNPALKTIELMYEAISLFFTTVYKTITKEYMEMLWKEVDLDYLLSLPYPAPAEEQHYVGDDM
jgi:hypothetical protein